MKRRLSAEKERLTLPATQLDSQSGVMIVLHYHSYILHISHSVKVKLPICSERMELVFSYRMEVQYQRCRDGTYINIIGIYVVRLLWLSG